jgi:hypothetical protein
MSGSYDPDLDLVYWAVGNPCPDFNGEQRKGRNLYTDSVLALKPDSGALKWYFQFTPHDTHDYDAAEPLMLIDDIHGGHLHRLLVQANRNGFFFVLNRTNGKFLSATPFVSKVTWASGYTRAGAPILRPDAEPTPDGNLACPAAGTNWMSASHDPPLQLFYFSATDRCGITRLRRAPFEWESATSTARAAPCRVAHARFARSIFDPATSFGLPASRNGTQRQRNPFHQRRADIFRRGQRRVQRARRPDREAAVAFFDQHPISRIPNESPICVFLGRFESCTRSGGLIS